MKLIVIGSMILVGMATAVFMQSRAGYETAKYDVVKTDGAFEVREYEPMLLVSTPMDSRGAFNRLFRYISGSNEAKQKISMTSPVFRSQEAGDYRMSFVVPKDVANAGAPAPTGENVNIEEMTAGRFAVYRFSGFASSERFNDGIEKLSRWIEENELKTSGGFITAGYDPPYTPPFLRRNEVLIRLAK